MDPEWEEAVAEREFNRLHRYYTFTKRDQADQNGWELHDSQHHEKLIGMKYAECWLCHPELG